MGTIGYIGPRITQHGIDGSRNNEGIGISHYKLFAVVQDNRDCSCKWQHTRQKKPLTVIISMMFQLGQLI